MAALLLLSGPVGATPALPPGSTLAFEDEFPGSELDLSKWRHRQLGPRRDGVNVEDAVSVAGGRLTLTTYTEDSTHYTGMVGTQDTFLQTYGYWEASIEFSDVPGMWSAFWIQTPTHGDPLGEPEIAGVEVDIIEHHAAIAGADTSDRAFLFVIWDGYGPETMTLTSLTGDLGLATGFHTYGLLWTPQVWEFYVDDQLIWTVDAPISQVPEYVILSSEVQEGALPGFLPPGGLPDRESSDVRMVVDWVRVWETPPEPIPALPAPWLLGLGLLWAGIQSTKRKERKFCSPTRRP